jgi:hypothetical protein
MKEDCGSYNQVNPSDSENDFHKFMLRSMAFLREIEILME